MLSGHCAVRRKGACSAGWTMTRRVSRHAVLSTSWTQPSSGVPFGLAVLPVLCVWRFPPLCGGDERHRDRGVGRLAQRFGAVDAAQQRTPLALHGRPTIFLRFAPYDDITPSFSLPLHLLSKTNQRALLGASRRRRPSFFAGGDLGRGFAAVLRRGLLGNLERMAFL
ncbi:hypothetical protein BESB_080020 [Besnoitia besnoiti]|uniref:Uncharacterized protein n=1 Tax=Besnoitia besnoiti TaxID=94643 RepID=A0A2A9MCW5_BESBE|nr:hypothetical protein BESB_080020 [Besnoitia besnoiti]PFH33786.1 hypothetical protein BESB_080020 [Besnoitia besnoiti]